MAAEALLEHLSRGVPSPIWIQYVQALRLAGFSVERDRDTVRVGWLVASPSGDRRYTVTQRDDGVWHAVPIEPP